jgi:hypothetical protein
MGFSMGLSVPSADPRTVWLADLIEAAEVLGASAETCDPAIMRAFCHRLEMPGLAPPADRRALHRLNYFRDRWTTFPLDRGSQ